MERISYSITDDVEIYKAIFNALPQSIFLLDKDKRIIGIFNAVPEILAGVPIEEIVGNNIMVYAEDPQSPFYQACSMINSTFDPVFETGIPQTFQYMVQSTCLEATIAKISGDRSLIQVHDISDIMLKQRDEESKKHKEVAMAMTAGGLTSWNYDVQSGMLGSKQENNVIENNMSVENLLALIEPEYRKMTVDMFDSILHHSQTQGHVMVKVRNRSGQLQWSDVHAIPFEYAPDGSVSLIIGSQKDVTIDHEYNEQLHRLLVQNELILNNTNSGFVYMTPDLDVEWENASRIFTDPEITCLFKDGKLCAISCKSQGHCVRATVQEAFRTKCKNIGKFKTSQGLVIESIAQPVLNDRGQVEGIVLRLDDVTQREQFIHELAEAKDRAERSDKLKSAFLANMSHEIRTPLNSIVGFAQLIPDADTPQEQQEYIDVVNSNSEVLLNLINDILDLSKIEAGYFSYTNSEFDLSDLFRELEVIFRHKKAPGVELYSNLPMQEYVVNLDRVRVAQIITNFATNAIKFTKQGQICLGYEIEGDMVRIYVSDTGVGMTDQEAHRVFDRFEKFNMFEQGTGLGTSIAKAIVDAYGGRIGVESTKGVGSTFWAMLPVNMSERENASTATKKSAETIDAKRINSTSKRILVAEDNDSNYMLAKALLRGYDLTRAHNGLQAVEKMRDGNFDLVLMDVRMPELDGLHATEQIRRFNPKIPIIVVTANAFDDDRSRAIRAGANDFLTKPLNKNKLLEAIGKY